MKPKPKSFDDICQEAAAAMPEDWHLDVYFYPHEVTILLFGPHSEHPEICATEGDTFEERIAEAIRVGEAAIDA